MGQAAGIECIPGVSGTGEHAKEGNQESKKGKDNLKENPRRCYV